MQTLTQIKAMLDERGLRPKRSLGQNFLVDQNLIRKIVEESGVQPGELVLEVGPGTGALTEALLEHGCRVVACELDDNLAAMLAERAPMLPGGENLRVVHADILKDKSTLAPQVAGALGAEPFSLVANLPYGAATPLIMTLVERWPRCRVIASTVQMEVAERLAAQPGTKAYGAITVLAQAMMHVRRFATLPRECFWPRPDVTSAMILLQRRDRPLTDDPSGLSVLANRLFQSRRKQLGSILGRETPLPEGVDAAVRPDALGVEEFVALQHALRPG